MLLRKAVHLAQLRRAERMGSDALRAAQQGALARMVAHAYETVPFYRERFDRAGLRAGQEPVELSALPVTRREDVLGAPLEARTSSRYAGTRLRPLRSSGTSGKPVELACDGSTFDLRGASILHTLLANGYRLRDDIACLERAPWQRQFLHPKLRFYHRVEIPFEEAIEAQVDRLRELSPRVVVGYASWVAKLARALVEMGIDDLHPYLVVTNSEQLTESMRESIRQAFHVEATNVYDTWEVGNVAWQCAEHRGLHVNASLLIVEILNGGREAEPGEPGEVVVTDLRNGAVPMLRYALGDLAVWSADPCPCGRAAPQIEKLLGRRDETLVGADGNEAPASVAIAGLMRRFPGVCEYQVRQDAPGQLEVLLCCDARFGVHEESEVARELRKLFHIEELAVRRVERIERAASGKLRPVISRIGRARGVVLRQRDRSQGGEADV